MRLEARSLRHETRRMSSSRPVVSEVEPRRGSPLAKTSSSENEPQRLVIDLGSPRNAEPSIGDLPNVQYVCVDDLEKIVSELASENALARIFQNASINLSFFGVGLEVSGSPKINNAEVALKKMLESLKHHGKRVLIAMDEVIRSKEIVAFASAFQLYIRDDLPVFLLMTGLYENIEELQNVKNLSVIGIG